MSRSSQSRWLMLALSLLMSLVSFSAMAQRADGNIGGDALPGDKVQISSPSIGIQRETVTGEDGRYRFRAVPLGAYEVTVTRGDQVVVKAGVTVRPGTTARPPKAPGADAAKAATSEPAPAAN